MFTEGLDRNSVNWIKQRGSPVMQNQRIQINGSRRFELPSTAKFSSGHFPSGIIPLSSSGGVRDSGSDMDTDSDTENCTTSGSVYHDFKETFKNNQKRKNGGCYWKSGGTEEEEQWSDSILSSEFGSTQVGSNNVDLPSRGGIYSESCYSSSSPVHSRPKFEKFIEKDFHVKGIPNKIYADRVPNAPPISDPCREVYEGVVQNDSSRTRFTADSDCFSIKKLQSTSTDIMSGMASPSRVTAGSQCCDPLERTSTEVEAASSRGLPARLPTFHASALGPWYAVISYDACVRLCLRAWAMGCTEAPVFLDNECTLLRRAFGLQHVLLQPEEELLAIRSSTPSIKGSAFKPKKTIGRVKVQVRKVKMDLDSPNGCSFSSLRPTKIKVEALRHRLSNLRSTFSSGWQAIRRVRVQPQVPASGSFSRYSLAYLHASGQYIKQVSGLLKIGGTTLRSRSEPYEVVQETYTCILRLKSSNDDETVRMQPGSGETHLFFPDSAGDDLFLEVQDSKGKYCGRVVAQMATFMEELGDKVRWLPFYREPEHELVGRIQLCINYSTSINENVHLKCGSVAETVAYDFVLEVAMKAQHFQQRNLVLHGEWKWLLTEFASYYGVSDAYVKLRYLSYVMDVATPTADCLILVYDLLFPVKMKGSAKSTLSHQENRILGEIEDQLGQILSLAFENYKALDEASLSGMLDVFRPATGSPAPALAPAVKLYSLLHDIVSPDAQSKLCSYFQVAAKKRSRRHLAETDEFITSNGEGTLMDVVTFSSAYQKMKSLCLNIRNEIFTDIEIHNQHLLPSFIDLPNISSSIYSVELCTRLRAFLAACPPDSPSSSVTELVIATADLQKDLISWNINQVKGGVDAKELFHSYIMSWIQDKRLSLLESCKLDKVKWSGVRTQHSTTPFVDDMYDRLKETLNEYEIILCRWPEYTFVLENAIADAEKALMEALDKQYADVLSPLRENMTHKNFGLKYVQKLANRSACIYEVPGELGVFMNSLKRMLDMLCPRIETQLKSCSCILTGGSTVPAERLSEITVMLRSKFRSYLQAIVEKLGENTKVQNVTKLKKILQEFKETVTESDVRSRIQPLKDQLTKTIDHLHSVFETHLFVDICRGYWDRMGQDVLSFLDNRKENRACYKGARVAVSILDDIFASQMQQLLGNALQEKDLAPPRSIMEVRSVLCKDTVNHKGNNYYY
ncbi:hypothetical protein C5167_038542 [Papaver somniferum]|uniref:Uncharacterized protein n=1 Tax=Papaver somniferum TaxID=3469 RepID=A0A4Y7IDS3_PAPSO|nr:uncharacterized protein LOC113296918 [Papaver somniferum]RZC45585.1 hypothetical protein C5167_038542 [Papaver somniferum]